MEKYQAMKDGDKYVVEMVAGFARFKKGEYKTKVEAENAITLLKSYDAARIKIEDAIRDVWRKVGIGTVAFKRLAYEVLEEL